MGDEEIALMKQSLNEITQKYEKQKQEMQAMEEKLSESENQISFLKAENQNFFCQMNEKLDMKQCEFSEKEFIKNMSGFSSVLQKEYRASIQAQCNEKEKNYKVQIEKLNKLLSETKNKLVSSTGSKH